MKKLMAIAAFLLLTVSAAQGESYTVYADAIWRNTGIYLNSGDTASIFNTGGSGSWGNSEFSGPGGWNYSFGKYDEWIMNGMHGQLIAFVGDVNPNTWTRVVAQDDPRLFAIGSGSADISGIQGTLWIGFNDAYSDPGFADDNDGFLTADVLVNGREPAPEPATLILLGSGLAALLGSRRKRMQG